MEKKYQEYLLKYDMLRLDFSMMPNIFNYIKSNKGLENLPDSIKNKSDACFFIINHNKSVIELNDNRLKLCSDKSIRKLPSVLNLLIFYDNTECSNKIKDLKKTRFIQIYGVDDKIDILDYL